jgi:hypothetical protein
VDGSDGRHNIVPPIIPEEQEFAHFNDLWCYLFYKLTGEEKDDKGIAAFTIFPAKHLTIAALLDRVFPAIPATDNKPMPYITTKTVAYIFALIIDSVTIFHQDSPHSRSLEHEASILEALNTMPADEFRTELRDSLTAFYENILKKTGAGGRPVAKPLIRKSARRLLPCTTTLPPAKPAQTTTQLIPPLRPLPTPSSAHPPHLHCRHLKKLLRPRPPPRRRRKAARQPGAARPNLD